MALLAEGLGVLALVALAFVVIGLVTWVELSARAEADAWRAKWLATLDRLADDRRERLAGDRTPPTHADARGVAERWGGR